MEKEFVIHLQALTMREWNERDKDHFPFTLDIIKSIQEIRFTAPVTFFVGENGSGKSTVMESIACAAESITVGSESVKTDKTLAEVRRLSQYIRLSWSKRTRRGFFLRAEDFFGYAKSMRQAQEDLRRDAAQVERDYAGRSKLAADLARLPYQRELYDMQRRYGEGIDQRSHGESFMTLFQSRFAPGGLYLLDEPEAALSPSRQLTFLAALKQMIEQEAQFIIATHSPILLAFPQADILLFEGGEIKRVKYEDLEHVQLTRDFLKKPDLFLKYL
ncbi:MAG: AAA family ATPase [Anaerolineales bacterium]